MKKILLPVMLLMLVAFAACDKESYYHTMSIIKPLQIGVVFADQDMDTLEFYTTDNFAITTNQSWATIPDTIKSGNIPNVYRMVWTVVAPVVFEPNTTFDPNDASDPNTTGKIRDVNVQINVNGGDDWNQTATATFRQLYWLSIERPTAKYSYKEEQINSRKYSVVTGAAFECEDSATQFTDTLEFYTFGAWTLTDGTFAHPEVTSGEAGQHKVPVTIEQNATVAKRETSVNLTSRGVTTPIKFIQEGKKEETN